jgi:hypothetical protein
MKPSTLLPSGPCSAWPRKYLQATGVTAMLTKYDAIIAIPTVMASGAKSFFARPASKTTGSSTAMVVSVEASTGRATALAPFSAASAGPIPSRW